MKYLQYCRNLQFEEKPDYNYLRSLFKSMMSQNGYDYDGQFDWVLKKAGRDDQLKALLQKDKPVHDAAQRQTYTRNEETKNDAPQQ